MKKIQPILNHMGLDATGAINLLFAQIERQGRLPFDVVGYDIPNDETQAAMREAVSDKLPAHRTKKAFFAALKSK